MTRQFFRVQLAILDQMLAVNASDLRAVLPLAGDKYQIWLSSDFEVSAELGKRLAKLGSVTPLIKDSWEVSSTDLGELLK